MTAEPTPPCEAFDAFFQAEDVISVYSGETLEKLRISEWMKRCSCRQIMSSLWFLAEETSSWRLGSFNRVLELNVVMLRGFEHLSNLLEFYVRLASV